MQRCRHRLAALLVAGVATLPGCTLPAALFTMFGDNYSAGGVDRESRQRHFEEQVARSQAIAETNY